MVDVLFSWTEVHTQYLRYVSDRTGIISFMNFPVIWLFATRNNVVEFLTGWSFATCTNFHRWVARVATLQAVIHSVGYTWMVMERMCTLFCRTFNRFNCF